VDVDAQRRKMSKPEPAKPSKVERAKPSKVEPAKPRVKDKTPAGTQRVSTDNHPNANTDAPMIRGVVVLTSQPGIDHSESDDGFESVKSRRQILADKREAKEKEAELNQQLARAQARERERERKAMKKAELQAVKAEKAERTERAKKTTLAAHRAETERKEAELAKNEIAKIPMKEGIQTSLPSVVNSQDCDSEVIANDTAKTTVTKSASANGALNIEDRLSQETVKQVNIPPQVGMKMESQSDHQMIAQQLQALAVQQQNQQAAVYRLAQLIEAQQVQGGQLNPSQLAEMRTTVQRVCGQPPAGALSPSLAAAALNTMQAQGGKLSADQVKAIAQAAKVEAAVQAQAAPILSTQFNVSQGLRNVPSYGNSLQSVPPNVPSITPSTNVAMGNIYQVQQRAVVPQVQNMQFQSVQARQNHPLAAYPSHLYQSVTRTSQNRAPSAAASQALQVIPGAFSVKQQPVFAGSFPHPEQQYMLFEIL
jgi:hypothetical protein